ncbi:AMP-binding protein [Gangjinia marincola]|uniref:AMP-binding protein n=1 Tax=Gangjinia marincola TaxID=578463 RepID=A0ABP3XSH4_9FLAO
MKSVDIHPSFKLNGQPYGAKDLESVGYNLIKEGEPHEESIGSFLLDWLNAEESITVQTSGSTGTPKAIKLSKEHMVNSALATGSFFELPENSTALLCLPAEYIAGKMMLVRAMVLGWQLDVVVPRANPLDQVYKRYDFCAMTPFQLDNSLSRLHLIKKLIVGGGAVSTNLMKLVEGIKTKVYETYGMTETITHIAARRINPKKPKRGIIPFKILPNVAITIDQRDCLVIKAPKISYDAIVTNDVVELVTYKKFIWRGRYDNVINSGGIKLYPEEIEAKLEKIIGHRFFVTALPDDALGDKLILVVEREFSQEALDSLTQEIKQLKSLDRFEYPKKILFIDTFIQTQTGKIHRSKTLEKKLV